MADGLATPPSILIPDPDHRELHSDLDIYIFLLQNEHVCQTLIDEANQIRPPSGPPVQLIHPNLFLPLWIRLHSTNGLFAQELQTRITLIADHLIQIYRFDSALIPSIIYNWTYHAFEDDNPKPRHNTHTQPTPTQVDHGPFYYIYEAHVSDTTDEGSSGPDSP